MTEFGDPTTARTVRVTVPVKAFNDLDSIQRVQREVLGQLGCEACCSAGTSASSWRGSSSSTRS